MRRIEWQRREDEIPGWSSTAAPYAGFEPKLRSIRRARIPIPKCDAPIVRAVESGWRRGDTLKETATRRGIPHAEVLRVVNEWLAA